MHVMSPLEHICYLALVLKGDMYLCDIQYDRLTKAPFSFGLPTCVLTHRAEGRGSGELDRTVNLLTPRQGASTQLV